MKIILGNKGILNASPTMNMGDISISKVVMSAN